MVTLFFRDTGKTICVRVLPNSPIKKYGMQKTFNVQPKLFWGKSVEKSSQTLLTLGQLLVEDISRKYCKKVLQWWAWEIELIACYITVRIPPNSLISPGCCILQECVRLRGYIREWGPPHFSLFALFQCRQNIYVIGDGNNACILVRNSYTKGLTKCYTDSGYKFRQIL